MIHIHSILADTHQFLCSPADENMQHLKQTIDNDIISMHQSGFTPGDSTVHQLVYLYNTFCKALNDKKRRENRVL